MVFLGRLAALAAVMGVLGQQALAHGRAALKGQAQLAAIAEAVDDIVAVHRALCLSSVSYGALEGFGFCVASHG